MERDILRRERARARKEKVEKIQIMIFIFAFFVLWLFVGFIENNYTLKGEVIFQEEDVLTVEDEAGLKWHYLTRERFEEGEEVKLYFNNNVTQRTRKDDELKKVKKIKKT